MPIGASAALGYSLFGSLDLAMVPILDVRCRQ